MTVGTNAFVEPQAHLHHAWDTYNRYGRTISALRIAALQTRQCLSLVSQLSSLIANSLDGSAVFQLTYTSLFGFHCAFLFLRTGSLLSPTVSHIFCNVMGFPQYTLHVRMFPKRRRGELLHPHHIHIHFR